MFSEISIFLSLFTLLLISIGIYFLAKKIKLPYTVLLVITGLLLIPISKIEAFSFVTSFELTPELLFFIFLPIIIFESAYNINTRKISENIRAVTILAVLGLLVSAFLIAILMYFGLAFIGFPIPFIVALLFGSLISATDPVAVLALFKEHGAPRRLSFLFEGESLFNDGTALALFLVVLEISRVGFSGFSSILEGLTIFVSMILGGALFGLLMGGLFSKLIQQVKNNEHIEITLTMIVAHLTFIFTELISSQFHYLQFSPIIATTIASIVIGNYGRYKISPKVEAYMEKFWSYFAFVANSLVFILIGMFFTKLPNGLVISTIPIILTIFIIIVARAISIYPLLGFANKITKEPHIPISWQHILSWGSLKGALAVTMVLLIPDNLTLSSWGYDFSIKEFLMALTISTIYFTLFVNASSMGPLIRKLNLTKLKDVEKIEYEESKVLVYSKVLSKISEFYEKGYLDKKIYQKLKFRYKNLHKKSRSSCRKISKISPDGIIRLLRVYAIGIEKHTLKNLFIYGEISEKVYTKILNKLNLQFEQVAHNTGEFDSFEEAYRKNWFERLIELPNKFFSIKNDKNDAMNQYIYYRALVIISRKVIRDISKLISSDEMNIFGSKEKTLRVLGLYQEFFIQSQAKIEKVQSENKKIIEKLNEKFAQRGILKVEEKVLKELNKKEMITPRLFLMLQEEFEKGCENT